MEKKVSVIVPVYRTLEWLARCVQSITGQTYKNLEIILVDDGSPDDCPALCDDWAQRDDRIRVLHKENGGLVSAWMAGVSMSTGDYLCFVDSDDWIDACMVEKMLDGTEVRLNVDYLADRENLNALAEKVVYTGPVDAYFGYRLGALQYRSVRFETEVLDTDNYQGNAVVNYTDAETPYTRIIEHKHFEFGTQPKTVISREYSAEWNKGDEPYYPVNDAKNGALYAEYKQLADAEPGVIFGGRLGEYKYYDMDKVIEVALDVVQKELA